MIRRTAPAALLAAALLTAAGCGSSGTGTSAGAGPTDAAKAPAGEKVQVVASFYPLEYAVQRVGGDHVSVTNLTKPGVEPHDLELTPQDVAKVSSAKLAVYLKGFQPAVEKAVTEQGAKGAYDVSPAADLETHALEEGHSADDGHDHGGADPHFWLDPQRYSSVAKALAVKLGEIDPAHQADFEKNAQAFATDLSALDAEFSTGLKTCTNTTMVTSHAAFGYLAERYGLKQKAISGLTPDKEPEPARLADISAYVKAHKITTIYTETLVSPAIAQTVARETGASTAVLDPIEGLSDASAGKDYLGVMRANLATLTKGQSCR
ncbi:MAG: metal ABC transporter substrate-binding protein [Austwickia sp.]|nr:metal ABC transporter substrate-binding protein [Actinomycetota bacterium]MCB1255082.1 zinc ABC transporter substrate-binding protein [Austwickia sp.]MCO5308730.1 metal ABC transporter substrate-binding protein [Austwickia sp.]